MSRPLTSEGEEWAQEEEGYPEGMMDEGESGSAEEAKGAKNAKDTDSAKEAPEAKGTKKVKKAPVVTSEGEERPTKRRSLDGGKYYTYDEFRDWWLQRSMFLTRGLLVSQFPKFVGVQPARDFIG